MENNKELPTDISQIPEKDRDLFEGQGQETQTKPEAEKPQAEVKPDATPEKENGNEKETLKPEEEKPTPAKKPDFVGVPVKQANAWRKEAAEFKQKAQSLQEELDKVKTKSPDMSQSDTDDFLKKWGEKYGLQENELEPYKELVEAATTPFKSKLSLFEKIEEREKQIQQEKEWNDYFDNEFSTLEELIKKEHQDISETEVDILKAKLKSKIEKQGLYQTPVEIVYNAYQDFRPSPKKKTIESSGKSPIKTIDKTSEKDLMDALASGDIDIDEVDKIMVKKGGGRFTVQP